MCTVWEKSHWKWFYFCLLKSVKSKCFAGQASMFHSVKHSFGCHNFKVNGYHCVINKPHNTGAKAFMNHIN